jgi:hypothetical protein
MAKKDLTVKEMAQMGGKARAKKLTPARRKEIATAGAEARMEKISPKKRSQIARNAALARWAQEGKVNT